MRRVHRSPSCLGVSLVLLLGLGVGGCGGSASPCAPGAIDCTGSANGGSFESDVPAGSDSHAGVGVNERATAGGTLSANPTAPAPSIGALPGGAAKGVAASDSASSVAERVISEADIIQVDGDRLYALSRVAGLAVIDVSKPEALRLLGRYRELPAEPFEMYLRDGTALVMFSGWGQYVKLDSGDYQWVSTSKLLALDVSDPSSIAAVGSFDLPGSISDSRVVGDILYVVSHQDGYCWRCEQSKPLTSVVSLDVSDPRAVQQIDQLQYPDGNASWGPRSVTVTAQRMYVGGPEYGSDMPTGSTIQVVDISDPKGDLVQGTAVAVKGQISSRWQMDEYNGVLRVISQPPQWWSGTAATTPAPSVQTFRVVSSDKLEALGQTDLVLPLRETLRSARFDGTRAYAITAEQKDPLFTIDLSDPAHPRQVGELHMPGFVYYMEPRGDRVLGLGFDQGNPEGSITVSLFDVKDLANPVMLSRVNFGGSWGSLPEDQDRIHKVFRVLDDVGLILVPFSGWNDQSSAKGCGYSSYAGGVQIIDFKNDTLRGRGAAPGNGDTRRALLQQGRLLTVSDQRVQAYDIGDRDAPKQLSEVILARSTYRALQLAGGAVARISSDDRTGQPSIDFVAAADAGEPNQSYGELDLSGVGGVDGACSNSLQLGDMFVHGAQLDILYDSYSVQGKGTQTQGLLVVDASDPKHAQVVSDTQWPNDGNWSTYYGFYSYGAFNAATPSVRTDSALAMLETSWEYNGVQSIEHVRLRVIDLRTPSAVKFSELALPVAESYAGLIVYGNTIYTSHFTGTDSTSGRARFYVDRFDISDPSAPRRLASINVPGSLMHYDGASGRALTTELSRVIVRDTTYETCYARFAYAEFVFNEQAKGGGSVPVVASPASGPGVVINPAQPTTPVEPPPSPLGICTAYLQRLHLVKLAEAGATLEDTLTLKEDQQLTASSMGAGVVFATLGHGGYYGGRGGGPVGVKIADCFGPCGYYGSPAPEPVELLVLGGFGAGKFEQGHIRVEDASNPWWGFWGSPPVYAYGKHALMLSQSDIAIIDATTPSTPTVARKVPLIASAQYVDVRDDTALLTLGPQGVQWLSLK
jgi:uncharacterized secreted protein with C-terminal beta-propeller domain